MAGMKRIVRDSLLLVLLLLALLVVGAVGVYFEINSRQAMVGAK
jgi:hypothetical protein